jgi:hypothetical protein
VRQYLHVSAGPYQFLLDAEGIHEILDLECSGAESLNFGASAHRDWRGRVLPAVNGRALLGMQDCVLPPSHAGVVYSAGNDDAPLMLELDRVAKLRYAEDHELQRLPPLPVQADRLFDCVLPDKVQGLQLFHLRRPLDIQALLAEWAALPEPAAAIAEVQSAPARDSIHTRRAGTKQRKKK